MRMRTIVTAVILSAGCVLGSSGSALANGWDGNGNESAGCGILAGAGGGQTFYAEGCQGDDESYNGDDERREDSHEDGQEGMSAPLDFGGFHH